MLDFDPDESIHYTRGQGWIMDPVIKVDQVVVSPDCSALNEDAACTMGRYDWTEERCLAVARPEDYVCADDKTCKAGVCVPLGTSPTTEQAYVADQRRRLMTTPDSETTFQLSFVDWLSPTQLNTLLVGTDLRIIRAKLLLPDVMNGLRLAVLLPGEPVVLPALDQPIEDAAAQLESLNPELATHLRAPGVAASARIGSLVGRGMATKVLRLWTLHPEAVRLVQVIESEVDKGQKPWEPGEDF